MRDQKSLGEMETQERSPWLDFFRQVRVLAARLDALERDALEADGAQKEQVPGG